MKKPVTVKEILKAIEKVPVFNASGVKWQRKEDIIAAIKAVNNK